MRTALPATITTALLVAAVRLHRSAVTRARQDGYLTALHDVHRGILAVPATRVDAATEPKEQP